MSFFLFCSDMLDKAQSDERLLRSERKVPVCNRYLAAVYKFTAAKQVVLVITYVGLFILFYLWQGSTAAQCVDIPVRKRRVLTPEELEQRRRKVSVFPFLTIRKENVVLRWQARALKRSDRPDGQPDCKLKWYASVSRGSHS